MSEVHSKRRGRKRRTHGESYGPEYQAWKGIKRRCLNAKTKNYRLYGGRGITICVEWRDSFEAFFAHVGKRPSNRYSIDRIDNDGNYEPGNVRWATRAEQNRNRRTSAFVEFNGQRFTLTEWAGRLCLKPQTLSNRIEKWGVEAALTTPRPASQFGNNRGELAGLCKLTGEKIIRIRAGHKAGRSFAALAREHGVTEGCIRAIIKRQTWKHVP